MGNLDLVDPKRMWNISLKSDIVCSSIDGNKLVFCYAI